MLQCRVPELAGELSRARDAGRHDRLMRRLAKVELLVLDDWGLQSFSADLAESIERLEETPTPVAVVAMRLTKQVERLMPMGWGVIEHRVLQSPPSTLEAVVPMARAQSGQSVSQ